MTKAELIRQVKELAKNNFPPSEIARRTGASKGTIAGLIFRLRARGELPPPQPKTTTPPEVIMEVTQQPDEPKLEAELDIEYEDAPEPVFTTGTPLTAMTTPVCMFPVDRVADTWLFCGKARKGGKSSYCAEHHALSWKSPTSKADDEREEQQNKIRWSFNPGAAQ